MFLFFLAIYHFFYITIVIGIIIVYEKWENILIQLWCCFIKIGKSINLVTILLFYGTTDFFINSDFR